MQIFGLMTLNIIGSYMGVHLDNLAASALVIGLVFTSRNLVQIFLRIPFSELSQIMGRKPLILAGIFCYSSALGLMYLANHWGYVLAAAILVGIGMSMHWPAVFSYIGDISSNNDYGRINGIIFQGQDLGVIIGAITAQYLLSRDIVDLQGLFGITFLVGIIGVQLSIFVLPEVLEEENRLRVESTLKSLVDSFLNMARSLVRLSKTHPLGLIFLFEFVVTFTEFFISAFFPLLVVVSLGFDDSVVAAVVLGSTIIQIFFRKYFGLIFDKWGYIAPVLIALTIASISMVVLTLVVEFWQLLLVYTITMSSIFICFIATTGATSNTAMPVQRGLAMGVLGVYISSGRAMSSIALSPVLDYFEKGLGSREEGLVALFKVAAIVVLVLVISLGMISKYLHRKNKI